MSDNEEESDPYDQKIKIMILGETLVGKTALITRYTKNSFAGTYLTTVGIDFQYKSLNINDKKIKVEIWDTAGQERFRNIAKNYFQSSHGFLLVYDISNRESFNKLNFWNEQITANAPENTKVIIVGNKNDLEEERQVKKEEGENFANNNKVHFYEINQNTFVAKNTDLILSSNMDLVGEENSMFKIGDLVRIKNSSIICYIIESTKFNLKVVTTRNEIKKISTREVEKINLKKKTTYLMDSKGYPLTPDNTVKIINGPNKGNKGTIKCIYNKYLFLHNNNYVRTNGIFCEINENVELLGSELLIENSEKGKVNHRKVPKNIKDLIGKTVHVIEGKWKGYNGILINADDKSIKLELSAKQKTISLPFTSIKEGDVNSAKDNDEPSITPTLSMKTPAYFLNENHP